MDATLDYIEARQTDRAEKIVVDFWKKYARMYHKVSKKKGHEGVSRGL